LDGPASARSQEALEKLGSALGIPDAPRQRADEIMQEIAKESERPERFDLIGLRRTLDARHEVARQARIAKRLDDVAKD
jgi:hypothetical protein